MEEMVPRRHDWRQRNHLTHVPLRIRQGLFGGFVMALVLLLILVGNLIFTNIGNKHDARQRAQQQGLAIAQSLDHTIGQNMQIAESLAADLTIGTLSYAAIDSRMRRDLATAPTLDGITVAFAPYAHTPGQRLYQSYVVRQADGSLHVTDGATYDYTQPPSTIPGAPRTDWYHDAITQGKHWLEPFAATGVGGKYVIEYSVPFTRHEAGTVVPTGVVAVDYFLQGMQHLVQQLRLKSTDYGFILSHNGTYLANPQTDLVAQTSIFAEQTGLFAATAVQRAVRNALKGEATFLDQQDAQTGQEVWLLFQPLRVAGWTIGIVLNPDEYLQHPQEQLQAYVLIALCAALVILLLSALLVHVEHSAPSAWWNVSLIFSVLCLLLIAFIWIFSQSFPVSTDTAVFTQPTALRYIQTTEQQQSVMQSASPIIIPTGISVNTIQFANESTIIVNGYIWQRYPETLPPDFKQGITFNQTTGQQYPIVEVKRIKHDHEEWVLWSFGLQFRQNATPDRYPFDMRDIAVRISPAETSMPVMLIPDFAAYATIDPHHLPGLDAQLEIPAWNIRESFFSYSAIEYATSLGFPGQALGQRMSTLAFNVAIARYPFGPLITYLIPALVAAALMFAYLFSDRRLDDPGDVIGILSYAAAIFFVISLLHTSLRQSIDAIGVTYLGWLYILLYVAILAVVIDAFLAMLRPNVFLIRFHNNLLAKILFWPLFLGIYVLITTIVFVFQ